MKDAEGVYELALEAAEQGALLTDLVKQERGADRNEVERRVRELAAFYGIQSQRLAGQLGFDLES